MKKKLTNNVYGFDNDWQGPARTEKHAFDFVVKNIEKLKLYRDKSYVGFPWASLIDGVERETEVGDRLKEELNKFVNVGAGNSIATVCQHIKFRKHINFFKSIGVTDIFASHAEKGETSCQGINIHPFPLYPVQGVGAPYIKFSDDMFISSFYKRKLDYSFIGAYSSKYYLTNSRELIFSLPTSESALIKERVGWHFEKRVYDEQIYGKRLSDNELSEESNNANEYIEIMKDTKFSLCPSGTGPNSIRLWEAIEYGSIPIILADSLALPGLSDSWAEACIIIPETEKEISRIPEIIRTALRDKDLIKRKLSALLKLKEEYGVNSFISDLLVWFEDSFSNFEIDTYGKKKVILNCSDITIEDTYAWLNYIDSVASTANEKIDIYIYGVEEGALSFEKISSNSVTFLSQVDLIIDWVNQDVATISSSRTLSQSLIKTIDVIQIIAKTAPHKINTSLCIPLLCNQDKANFSFDSEKLQSAEWRPICSIITSLFNGDAYIDSFLENCGSFNDYENIEHFIVRPNSPGREHNKLIKFVEENPSVVYLWLAQDPGLYDVWNLCTSLSTSSYLTNANIDDARSPRHISSLTEALINESTADVVSSALRVSDEMNLSWQKSAGLDEWYLTETPITYSPDKLIKKGKENVISYNIPHCMPVWRAGLHAFNGTFDENKFGPSADWEFWLRCGRNGSKFMMQGQALGIYYRAPMSYWRRNTDAPNYDEIIAGEYADKEGKFLYSSPKAGASTLIDEIMNSLRRSNLVRLVECYRLLILGVQEEIYKGKALLAFIDLLATKVFCFKSGSGILDIQIDDSGNNSCQEKEISLQNFIVNIIHHEDFLTHRLKSNGNKLIEIINTLSVQTSSILPVIIAAHIQRQLSNSSVERKLLNFAHTKNKAQFWELVQHVYRFTIPLSQLVNEIDGIPNYCNPENFEQADELYFFPDYSHGNPYQTLLYRGLKAKGINLKGINDIELVMNKNGRRGQVNKILHIHWINILFKDQPIELYQKIADDFITKIKEVQGLGIKVFWTVHNRFNHDALDKTVEKDFRHKLSKTVDKVFVHHPSILPHLSAWLTDLSKVEFIEHGNYVDYYPNTLTAESAREKLGLLEDDIVISVLGLIRPYKNLYQVLKPIREVMKENPKLKLVIAGKISCEETQKELSCFPKNQLIVVNKFIPDDDLQIYLNAADYILLSYKDILTSGSMFQALSFGKPLIAPTLGSIPSYIINNINGYTYSDNNELYNQINKAISLQPGVIESMIKNSFITSKKLKWI